MRPIRFLFEDLDVYKMALDFADDIAVHIERFPRRAYALSDQLGRASISVVANIAEGNGRNSLVDRRKFFVIARGSLAECVPLLDLAHRRQLVPDDVYTALRARLHRISRMLNGLIRNPGGASQTKRR